MMVQDTALVRMGDDGARRERPAALRRLDESVVFPQARRRSPLDRLMAPSQREGLSKPLTLFDVYV